MDESDLGSAEGGGGGSCAADGWRLPRAAGACTFGPLFSISRHRIVVCGLYVTHGQNFPRARGRRFPGPVVHPRVAVATSTLFVVIHREKGRPRRGDRRPRATAIGCRLCLLERPTPAVFSYQKNRHGPAASANLYSKYYDIAVLLLIFSKKKMIFHTKFYQTPHGLAKSIF